MNWKLTRRALLPGLAAALAGGRGWAEPKARFSPATAGAETFDHAAFGGLLKRYVRAAPDGINRVDYRRWKGSGADLEILQAYLSRLQRQAPGRLTRQEQLAYWINLYNAETLRIVLAAYPVGSILSIRPSLLSIGPWKKASLTVGGVALSLDQLENAILRPLFRDNRVHYALNCASLGCPNLRPEPWRGATLDSDLDAAASTYIGHPRGARLTPRGIRLSSIYKWYRDDFGDGDAAVRAHLRRYAVDPLRSALADGARIVGYDYDWTLNAVGP